MKLCNWFLCILILLHLIILIKYPPGINSRYKTILFWNGDAWFKAQTNIGQGFEEGFKTFRSCSHTNCFITKNNSMLNDPYYIIDAIVLQGDAIQIDELRKLKELKQNRKLLKERNRGIIPKIVLFNRVCLMEQFFSIGIYSQQQHWSLIELHK